MYRYEPRDKSGPMEVDNPDPMARLAQYAIPQEDGPSRKRQSPLICVSYVKTDGQDFTWT